MPHIFNLYKEICNIDIGTIAIYTCKKSCNYKNNTNGFFLEEYAYIQRTGENIIDLSSGKNSINNSNNFNNSKNKENQSNSEDTVLNNLNKLTIKNNTDNTPDEDGFVEVKKKKKK